MFVQKNVWLRKVLAQMFFFCQVRVNLGKGVRINLRPGGGKLSFSKTILFQKVLAGEAKLPGKVNPKEEMPPPPENSRVKNLFYHPLFVSKAHIKNLGPLDPPIVPLDVCPGGWVWL